jgi:quinoprotein glucose dehydrogenase
VSRLAVFVAIVSTLAPALLNPHPALAQHATQTPAFDAATSDIRKFQVAPGLHVRPWAVEPQLENPVAFSLTPGHPANPTNPPTLLPVTAWVAETHRYGVSVLDITQNTPWLLNDLSLRSVPDRTDFLTRSFSTNAALLTRDSERIRRLDDSTGTGRADRSEVFADGFNTAADGTAAGILAAGDGLWFANIPDLWRISIPPPPTNSSPGGEPASAADRPTRQSLATGFGVHIGVTGHDLHGLTLGPDGRLYASFGDRGLQVTNREGAVLHAPDTGGVVRCEPDGRNLELFCVGLRNPQELAFDHHGNLFTVDNDTAGTDDCRVLHLVEGADYGWRTSYQHMKGFGPWAREGLWRGGSDGILPPAGKVSQGPAGLTFHPGGNALGGRFVGRFLHCDFPGGVWAFDLAPSGSTFRVGAQDKVVWNCWPTDVEFGPDGALYILDWVSGWGIANRGRIHRIVAGDSSTPDPALREVFGLLRDGLSHLSPEQVLPLLAHPDHRIRLAAADELLRGGPGGLDPILDLARRSRDATPRRHALWVASRMLRAVPPPPPEATRDILRTAAGLLEHPDTDARIQALRLLGDHGGPEHAASILARALDHQPAVRAAALHAAARRRLPIPPAVWQREGDAFERLALSRSDAPASARSTHAVLLSLRRRASPAVAAFLTHANPGLILEAARAIHDLPIPESLPALAGLIHDPAILDSPLASMALPPPPGAPPILVPPRDQLLLRILNAHFQLGEPRHASNLVAFAAGQTPDLAPAPWPAHLRAEALFLLAHWAIDPVTPGHVPVFPTADANHGAIPTVNPENWPGWFDRITGRWNPLPPRPPDAARLALASGIQALIQDPEIPVALAAVSAATHLQLTNAAARMVARLMDPTTPPTLRRALPAALVALQSDLLPIALQTALDDPDPDLQAAAIPALGGLKGTSGVNLLVGKLQQVLATHPPTAPGLRLGQAALDGLAALEGPEADAAIADALRRLIDGALPPALELNLLETARRRSDPTVRSLLDHRDAGISANDTVAPWRDTLAGGDAIRGRVIFFEKTETQCARCHRIGNEGGTLGPALDGVASIRDRRHLLESILAPSAQVAPGFENVLVSLHDGRDFAGTIRSEDERTLTLSGTEEGDVRLEKRAIAARTRGLSAMPEGLREFLTRRELRDLVEYLASLTTPDRR